MSRNNKPLVLIDVDDSIIDLVTPWLDGYNNEFNDTLTIEDITDWDITKFVKKECGNYIYNFLNQGIYSRTRLFRGVKEGLEYLRSFADVKFATTSTEFTMGAKFALLKRNGIVENVKDYIEIGDKSILRCDYIIDDNFDNIMSQNNHGTIAILFDRPWNRKFGYKNRAMDWADLIEKMKGKFYEPIETVE
jgi:5'(3')-deoxyribonucleotidase